MKLFSGQTRGIERETGAGNAEGNILRGQPARPYRLRHQTRAGNYLIIFLYITVFIIININHARQTLASNRFDSHVTKARRARDVLRRPVSA